MSGKEKIKTLISKYGKIALYTHISLSLMFFGGVYFLVSRGFDWKKAVNKLGIDTSSPKWSSGASNLAVAYVIYKTTMPVRIGVTLSLVPLIAKVIRRK